MKLLLIDDNVRLIDRIQHYLSKDFTIDAAHNGTDGIEKANSYEYNVIVLDLGLPDMSGTDVFKALRLCQINTPILILSGIDDAAIRADALETGVDDFLLKPFDINELRARIIALDRRRIDRPSSHILHYGDITIDPAVRKVTRAKSEIKLRRKEFDILEYLVKNQGHIMTREMIMNYAWPTNTESWTSTIDVHVKHLRDKIDKPFSSHTIKTAYGIGYLVDKLS